MERVWKKEFVDKVKLLNARLKWLPTFVSSYDGRRHRRFACDIFLMERMTGDLHSELFFQWRCVDLLAAQYLTARPLRWLTCLAVAAYTRHAIGNVAGDVLPAPHFGRVMDALDVAERAYVRSYYGSPLSEDDLDELLDLWCETVERLKLAFETPEDSNEAEAEENEEEEEENEGAGGWEDPTPDGGEDDDSARDWACYRKPKIHAFNHMNMWIRLNGKPQYYSCMGLEMFHKPVMKDYSLRDNHKGSSTEAKMLEQYRRRVFVRAVCEGYQGGDADVEEEGRDEDEEAGGGGGRRRRKVRCATGAAERSQARAGVGWGQQDRRVGLTS